MLVMCMEDDENYITFSDYMTSKSPPGIVQSVYFEKGAWSVPMAVAWLKANRPKVEKLDEDYRPGFLSFRQFAPYVLKQRGYTKYRTLPLKNGVYLVMAYKA